MKTLFYITFLLLIVSAVYSQKERKYIRNGNQDYLKNEFEESELSYRKAVENQSDSSGAYKASFNLSDALYKQEKFPEAINQLNYLTSQQKNKEDLAKVYHNLGNSYLSSGEIEKSIDAYKNALRNNPNDKETKYNLAYAQHLIKNNQNNQSKNNNKEQLKPSEYAKQLKAKADGLVLQKRYQSAYQLMNNGLAKDRTVAYYQEFIENINDIVEIMN